MKWIMGKKRWDNLLTAVFFLLPSFLLLAVFNLYPMVEVLRLSFFKWNKLTLPPSFTGFDNYIKLFSDDHFWSSLRVTCVYTIVVTVVSILLGLFLALMLNRNRLIFKSFWRVLYFLPNVTPPVAAAMVWILLFTPSFGYVNTFLGYFHINPQTWLSDVNLALPVVMTLGIWRRVGFTLIVYLAALQAIAQEYYDSARVDGAGPWQTFSRITVPLVAPTTLMLVTLGLIESFLVFDQVLIMTRGGPASATMVLGVFLYNNAFYNLKIGYGSTISVVILFIVAIITVLQWRLVGFGRSETEEEK